MKKFNNYFTLLLILCASTSIAQEFKTIISNEINQETVVSHIASDDLSSDDYSLIITLHKDETFLTDYNASFIQTNVFVNEVQLSENALMSLINSLESSYAEEEDYFAVTPSVKYEFQLGEIIKASAHQLKEKNNQLKVEFVYENSILTTALITFDVPGFSNYSSTFCDLSNYATINDDASITQLITSELKKTQPAATELSIMSSVYGWSEYTEDGKTESEASFMVIFKENNQFWSLKYSITYQVINGTNEQATIKFYNGLNDPFPLSNECLTSLKNKL